MNLFTFSTKNTSRFGASRGCVTETIDKASGINISRFGASHGCVTATEPGLASKRLIPGRSLGKTNPPGDDDLTEFVKLQKKFADLDRSWTMDGKDIDPATFDLSVTNPNTDEKVVHRSPQEIMDKIATLDHESAEVLATIWGLL